MSKGSILNVDKAFYRSLIADPAQRQLVESHVVPIRSGFAWKVPAGHVFRIVTLEGPQVADFNMWNLHNPRERMWASRTRQLQQAHVSTHDRLWSTLPYLRPMATITEDTLASYGVDSDGGRVHDCWARAATREQAADRRGLPLPLPLEPDARGGAALTELDVHDVLNVFQVTGLNDDDKYFMKACPAQPGDYLEMFAEIDLLCALSTCPGGDLSVPMWARGARSHRRVPAAGRRGLRAGSGAAARLDIARSFTV